MPESNPLARAAKHAEPGIVQRRPRPTLLQRLLAVSAAVAIAAIGVALPATVSFADDNEGVAIRPADDAGGADVGRNSFSYQVGPGQALDDSVLVTNTGSVAQTVAIFATDAYNDEDGAYGLLPTAKDPVQAGSWVTFENGQRKFEATLDAGASQSFRFTVSVPADAEPGDHPAGIVASALQQGDQITIDRRVATRLYVRVPGELQANLSISSIGADYKALFNPFDGSSIVTYTLRNTGNVALGADTIVGTRTWFGIEVGERVQETAPELLPGNTRTVKVEVPGVAQWGFLTPYVDIKPTVTADALNPGPLPQVTRDTTIPAIPWFVLIMLVIGLIVWLGLVRGRKRDERRAVEWADYTEKQARERARQELVGAGGSGAQPSGEREPWS